MAKLTSAQAAVIYAASQAMSAMAELIAKARSYPDMTEEEADLMVEQTTSRAKVTVADWKSFREG